jgi:regulatory protein
VRHRSDIKRPPIGPDALERLALHYAGRYATTRSKLRAYLLRKVRERGWSEEGEADIVIDGIVERFQQLGYVDDAAFADARAASLGRRGMGQRRVDQSLKAAGIDEQDSQSARSMARDGAWAAAVRFAQRKRLGPFATSEASREDRQKAFAAMMRAGHPVELARTLLALAPGTPIDANDPEFA